MSHQNTFTVTVKTPHVDDNSDKVNYDPNGITYTFSPGEFEAETISLLKAYCKEHGGNLNKAGRTVESIATFLNQLELKDTTVGYLKELGKRLNIKWTSAPNKTDNSQAVKQVQQHLQDRINPKTKPPVPKQARKKEPDSTVSQPPRLTASSDVTTRSTHQMTATPVHAKSRETTNHQGGSSNRTPDPMVLLNDASTSVGPSADTHSPPLCPSLPGSFNRQTDGEQEQDTDSQVPASSASAPHTTTTSMIDAQPTGRTSALYPLFPSALDGQDEVENEVEIAENTTPVEQLTNQAGLRSYQARKRTRQELDPQYHDSRESHGSINAQVDNSATHNRSLLDEDTDMVGDTADLSPTPLAGQFESPTSEARSENHRQHSSTLVEVLRGYEQENEDLSDFNLHLEDYLIRQTSEHQDKVRALEAEVQRLNRSIANNEDRYSDTVQRLKQQHAQDQRHLLNIHQTNLEKQQNQHEAELIRKDQEFKRKEDNTERDIEARIVAAVHDARSSLNNQHRLERERLRAQLERDHQKEMTEAEKRHSAQLVEQFNHLVSHIPPQRSTPPSPDYPISAMRSTHPQASRSSQTQPRAQTTRQSSHVTSVDPDSTAPGPHSNRRSPRGEEPVPSTGSATSSRLRTHAARPTLLNRRSMRVAPIGTAHATPIATDNQTPHALTPLRRSPAARYGSFIIRSQRQQTKHTTTIDIAQDAEASSIRHETTRLLNEARPFLRSAYAREAGHDLGEED